MATIQQKIEAKGLIGRVRKVTATLVNGAAAGTFVLPRGAVVTAINADTPTTIPGTPTTTNLRLGSAASGQQYVADVDVKTQGFLGLTLLYPIRNAASAADATVHYTLTSTGGTAASQVGPVVLYVSYAIA